VIELRHLRYFVAVAEELNFTRAAARLHIAQPPLSVAIRQLEAELGAELLARSTREVRLTQAGVAFLEGTRRTLAELDHSVVAAQSAAAGKSGALRVGFGWATRFDTLPTIGQTFRSRYPGVALLTEEMWNARMPQALRTGAIDIAVALCPDLAGDLAHEPIRRERVVALMATDHPLALPKAVELGALAEAEFVLFPRELAPRLYDTLIAMCRNAGFDPVVRSETLHTDWALGVLGDVAVVTLVPESIAREPPAGLVAVGIEEPAEWLETSLVWLADRLAPAAAVLRDVAVRQFSDGDRRSI
jgi:DNA-binding transcriptional LysR family regulator